MEKIEITVESWDGHARMTLPDDPDTLKALLCDAMSQNDNFLNAVCGCVAGWWAFQPDAAWEHCKDEMDRIRTEIRKKLQL